MAVVFTEGFSYGAIFLLLLDKTKHLQLLNLIQRHKEEAEP